MKKSALFIILLGLLSPLAAQILQWTPLFATADDTISIIYDAKKGDGGLVGAGEIYAHTGVLTENSKGSWDWKYVKTAWGQNTPETKLTPLGDNKWQIRFHIRSYYGLPADIKATHLAFVFRNANSSRTGRDTDGGDIFLPLSAPGMSFLILAPQKRPAFYNVGDSVHIEAVSTNARKMRLFLDEQLVSHSQSDTLAFHALASAPGKIRARIEAVDSLGASRSLLFYYLVNAPLTVQPLPDGAQFGVSELSPTQVILALQAPQKNFSYLIGDWSDWEADPNYYMKRTPDGETYWLQLQNLTPGDIYRYQYWVNGKVKIADPYAELVLDPANDKYIDAATFPDMPDYPVGKTEHIVSVLQTGIPDFTWNDSFQRPAQEKLVIYELLVRDFIKAHNYATLIDTLDYFSRLGVNAIELMPVNEFEGNLSWGYNPSFYFAPDKYYGRKQELQRFIDEAHKRGIAVILDMVLNHSYEQSPLVRLYQSTMWQNPWYNEKSPNPDFAWGYDFNHESRATQQFVDRVTSHWLTTYHVDGFRFDFTKGFTNTPGNGWAYDQARINILQRMADHIWSVDAAAYVILEHFTDNSEEKKLTDYGMMIWGNSNSNYNEATMGYHDNGKSDFSWGVYKKRGWSKANLVTYMESHDEERLMYKNLRWGNSSGAYTVQNTATALARMEAAAALFFPIPGPKMLWQFGEMGYDYSIDKNGRTGEKPIRWDYLDDPDRRRLFNVFAALIKLKQKHKAFSSADFTTSFAQPVKWMKINDDSTNVLIIGNFDVVDAAKDVTFQHAGEWYDYFSGEALTLNSAQKSLTLHPGEYHIYTDAPLQTPNTKISAPDDKTVGRLLLPQNYPNPFNPNTTITFSLPQPEKVLLSVYDLAGRQVRQLVDSALTAGQHHVAWDGREEHGRAVSSGVYFCRLRFGDEVRVRKMLLTR